MGLRATAVIKPVKLREYVAELHCDVLRVVGFRVACGCGWRSSTQPTMGAARFALRQHRLGCAKPRAVVK